MFENENGIETTKKALFRLNANQKVRTGVHSRRFCTAPSNQRLSRNKDFETNMWNFSEAGMKLGKTVDALSVTHVILRKLTLAKPLTRFLTK